MIAHEHRRPGLQILLALDFNPYPKHPLPKDIERSRHEVVHVVCAPDECHSRRYERSTYCRECKREYVESKADVVSSSRRGVRRGPKKEHWDREVHQRSYN